MQEHPEGPSPAAERLHVSALARGHRRSCRRRHQLVVRDGLHRATFARGTDAVAAPRLARRTSRGAARDCEALGGGTSRSNASCKPADTTAAANLAPYGNRVLGGSAWFCRQQFGAGGARTDTVGGPAAVEVGQDVFDFGACPSTPLEVVEALDVVSCLVGWGGEEEG